MNLGILENHLARALRAHIGAGVDWRTGPVSSGPATGIRAQVFVHAATFTDSGGVTVDGAHVARQPVARDGGVRGFSEHRPGVIDIEVSCVTAHHSQAQVLAGLVAPVLLEAVETLAPALLSDPENATGRLRLVDHRAHLQSLRSQPLVWEGTVAAQVTLGLRITGFVHVQLVRKGGLPRTSAYQTPLRLEIKAGQVGGGVRSECIVVNNAGEDPIDLGGWVLQDAARRPHVYTFAPDSRVGAHQALSLWTGRGSDGALDRYWGRRQAVWNNSGDVAVLRDPDGEEQARASWSPPLPEPLAAKPRTRRRR